MTPGGVPGSREPAALFERLLLPTAADTLLLRACLMHGQPAARAFADWAADAPAALRHVQQAGGPRRRLLPLLQVALQREGVAAPALLQPLLRAAALYEQLRTQAYTDIAAHVLQVLTQADIPFLATRGVVFAQSVYAAGLRHCHDIDLLIPEAAREAATALLIGQCGFNSAKDAVGNATDLVLLHASGLPLTLHTHAMRSAMFTLSSWNELYAGRTVMHVGEAACPVLRPELALLQVLLLGPFGPQRGSLVWVCDAYRLIEQTALDWTAFAAAITTHLELLPVLRVLEYLARELSCPVPASLLQDLRDRSSKCGIVETRQLEQTLLLGLLGHGAVIREELWRQARTARERALAARVLLWSSAMALRKADVIGAADGATTYRLGQVARALRWFVRGGTAGRTA